MTLKATYNIVRCGQSNCDIKDSCPHARDHKKETDCNIVCIRGDCKHKCYNIIEQRKIKLKKLEIND